jgi:thiol:disulfide interchange protein DsbA
MKKMKKYLPVFLSALIAGLCLLPLPAAAQPPVAGRDYTVIDPPQPTDDPERIEVVEFFSYACPHCNELNPLIQEWAEDLPRDVLFTRIPVNFNPFYGIMARLFYTLEATGDLARLDAPLFAAIHEEGQKLVSEKSIADWAVSQGVDARRFSEAWKSFTVDARLRRADQLARNHHIRSVPAIVVDGRYLIGGKSLQELLTLTDQVVAMRRGEKNGASQQ